MSVLPRPHHLLTALLLILSVSATSARAQGYGLYEQGACTMGRGGAGVATPCDDGSAIFFNPAALTELAGTVASVGVTGVAPRGQFTNDTTGTVSRLNDRTFLAPTIYIARRIATRAAVGIGVMAPYGLASDWPDTSEGRFLGYFSSLQSVYVQPTVAYRLTDRVSIGGGLDITRMTVELRRRVDLAAVAIPGAPSGLTFQALGVPPGTDFADVRLTGNGISVGGHLGVTVKAGDRVAFGARYLLGQHVDIDNGQVKPTQIPTGLTLPVPLPGVPVGTPIDMLVAPQFAAGRTLGAQGATTEIPLPDQFVAGAAIKAGQALTLFVDYQFTKWHLFDRVTIHNDVAPATVVIGDYRDTHGVRVGAEGRLTRGLVVRAGLVAHTAGAPDQSVTPILPEAPRREYTAGVSVPLTGRLRLDAAYQFIDQEDRRGRTTDGELEVPTAAVNNGEYHYHANLFGASLVVRF